MPDIKPSILIVYDEADTCANLADILTDCGYTVHTALSGDEALGRVREAAYDVALLDLKMPGMDGLTLYREIKKLRPATVAIVITAYASRATQDAARNAGTWHMLPKPVEVRQLLPLVAAAANQPLVLIIDDDHELCHTLWDLLRDQNYRVALAHSAADADSQLGAAGNYRIVLLDLKLPDGNSHVLAQRIRRTHPDVGTILITAHGRELSQLVDQALANGADAVCYKPFNVDELLGIMSRLTSQ